MNHAIRISATGGDDVLQWEAVTVPAPGAGEVTVRHEAIGVNFLDTYHRSGLYPLPLPSGLGMEAAGVITAVGTGVVGLREGDRVAYCSGPIGAYAESRTMPAAPLVPLPAGISAEIAAAIMLKGLTAQYLLRKTYEVKPGDPILFHAAAGGVGQIACQWAKALGATVIGTVGSEAKVSLAHRYGCDHVLLSGRPDLASEVRRLAGGEGVAVVYDGVGKDTFTASLDSLRPLGLMVSFGNASGPVPPVNLLELSKRGSLFITRPTLFTHTRFREDLLSMAAELFDLVGSGRIHIDIGARYPLAEAARAHRDLEGRRTTGAVLLMP